jgi:alanine racemase
VRPIEERLEAAGLPPLPRTAWLEIDLDAVARNLARVRALTGPGVRIEPVVKADAYGHGAVPLTRALEAGVDGFCIATWDEAIELRRGGIRAPILSLFPIPERFALDAARRGVATAVGDAGQVGGLARALSRHPGTGPRRPLRLHLEVETGLGRGGINAEDVREVAGLIRSTPGLRLDGIWTHLQEPEDEARTRRQLERFDLAWAALVAAGGTLPRRHVSASGDFLHPPLPTYETVRPGLLIYGLELDDQPSGPDGFLAGPRHRIDAEPVLSLHARPVRVVDLPRGWGVSYGPVWTAERPSRIATLPLGYADGWPRSLTNRAAALVRGHRTPIVGTVAMDALMVDVTDVPGSPVTVDDEFVLIGSQGLASIGVGEVARARTTISREVVTDFSRRLPRVYHAAAGPVAIRTLLSGAP